MPKFGEISENLLFCDNRENKMEQAPLKESFKMELGCN